MSDLDEDYDDPPEADPEIRRNYEQALGRLILAHNEVDYWLSAILLKAVRDLAPDSALDELATGDFARRALNLQLLMKAAPQIHFGGIGKGRLAELNGIRNILAHAHFDQNPFDGTFEIVERRHRSQKARTRRDFPTERINAVAEELENIARHMSAVDAFWDAPIPSGYDLAKPL